MPESFKETEYDLSCGKIELEKIGTIDSVIVQIKDQLTEVEDSVSCSSYHNRIYLQREVSSIFLHQLQECLAVSQNKIDKKAKFSEAAVFLMDWCDKIEEKIANKYFGSLERTMTELNEVVNRDISNKKEIYSTLSSLGQELIKCDVEEESVPTTLSIIQRKLNNIYNLYDTRIQILSEMIKKKKDVNTDMLYLNSFLKNSENILLSPLNFDEQPQEQIVEFIDVIEDLIFQMNKESRKINSLSSNLSSLISNSEAFSCFTEKNLYLHSFQSISHRYQLLQTIALQRKHEFENIGAIWDQLLHLLENIETWLSLKEEIVSKINYIETNHSRKVYLKGIKLFENLNHEIQDNVHLLHDVNTSFHHISQKELQVTDNIKSRVLSANSRWHSLYEKVSTTLETIKNILQLWENYDSLKGHLLLFLTEFDQKLTVLEQSKSYSQEEYTLMMKEIYLHEEELLKFVSLANHLKVLSECSVSSIESDVNNIQFYWDEILKRLSSYKEKINIDYSVTEKAFTTLTIESKLENFQERDKMNENDISKSPDEIECGESEFQKDLIAALEEAQVRIESLECVLLEPTPSGETGESAPNYSRLLAACRSSIDVIQHLNQILSENPCHGDSNLVQFQAEDMMSRWEKIENETFDKELRAMKNAKRWREFSQELQNIEKWLLDSLQMHSSENISAVNMEKLIILLRKHQALIIEMEQHKKSIITLNATSQNIGSSKDTLSSVNEKLKDVNEHWDKLYLLTLEWQKKLQEEFLQSPELANTLSEMELWLKDSKERINNYPPNYENYDIKLHDEHTEIFAMKQQLDNCLQQVQILLQVSDQLFKNENLDEPSTSNAGFMEVKSKLKYIVEESQDLLTICTERLQILSTLLLSQKVSVEETSTTDSSDENRPGGIKKCCQYLVRVARASIPIQAILFLLLGAAIFIPKDEEELSCRFSNNFASSLNTMLRYPGGPPPV